MQDYTTLYYTIEEHTTLLYKAIQCLYQGYTAVYNIMQRYARL